MKTLKNLAASVVAATLLVACGDNAVTPTNDPLAGVTLPTCPPVQNPLTEYWWMAREVDRLVKTETKFNAKIYKGQYKNTTLYLIEDYQPNNTNLLGGWVLDCNGKGLVQYCRENKATLGNVNSIAYTPCKDDKYMPLKAQMTNLTLLFEEK
jgi:hypothetical protein